MLHAHTVGMGLSSQPFSDEVDYYDDADHMEFEGEFAFQVNETCLHGNSKSFLITSEDRDSHNPMLVHLTPQEMTWNERKQYISGNSSSTKSEQKSETEGQQTKIIPTTRRRTR